MAVEPFNPYRERLKEAAPDVDRVVSDGRWHPIAEIKAIAKRYRVDWQTLCGYCGVAIDSIPYEGKYAAKALIAIYESPVDQARSSLMSEA